MLPKQLEEIANPRLQPHPAAGKQQQIDEGPVLMAANCLHCYVQQPSNKT
jgi:hypothetical protein